MTRKSVLAIGIDPAFADFTTLPGLTPELVRHHIEAELERVRGAGFEVQACLVDPGGNAEPAVAAVLNGKSFDAVVIGAGLREPAANLLLFETVINLVHRLAPHACICFNRNPADTVDAVRRWIAA